MGIIVNQNSDPTSVDRWALVTSGVTVDLIVASLAFINDILGNYDYAVDISVGGQSVGVGYTYNSGANTFTAPALNLSVCQMTNLSQFNTALQAFSDSHYPLQTQFRFFMLYYLSQQAGLTNRAAYITPLFTWANSIMNYAAIYAAQVMAITDPQTALNHSWDFSQIQADPGLTLATAIQILN